MAVKPTKSQKDAGQEVIRELLKDEGNSVAKKVSVDFEQGKTSVICVTCEINTGYYSETKGQATYDEWKHCFDEWKNTKDSPPKNALGNVKSLYLTNTTPPKGQFLLLLVFEKPESAIAYYSDPMFSKMVNQIATDYAVITNHNLSYEDGQNVGGG